MADSNRLVARQLLQNQMIIMTALHALADVPSIRSSLSKRHDDTALLVADIEKPPAIKRTPQPADELPAVTPWRVGHLLLHSAGAQVEAQTCRYRYVDIDKDKVDIEHTVRFSFHGYSETKTFARLVTIRDRYVCDMRTRTLAMSSGGVGYYVKGVID